MEGDALRREELANFLRARRDELQPEDVGLVRRGRRRVRGLRRHEVADLAAVSVTWYTWLEQGRDIHVSLSLLDAVCRALQLDDEAWRYVRRLAGSPVLEAHPARVDVDPALVTLLDELLPSPAIVATSTFDFLAWNRAYTALFDDPDSVPDEPPNGLWMLFTSETLRSRLPNWETEAQEVVSRVRAEYGKNPQDERLRDLIAGLTEASEEFRAAWQRPQVGRFAQHEQLVEHPTLGRMTLHPELLRPLDRPGLLVTVYLPADSETRARLVELLEQD